jgi:hypothetical protein
MEFSDDSETLIATCLKFEDESTNNEKNIEKQMRY